MPAAPTPPSPRRDAILDAAIGVFGRFGFRKTSVDDLATAAQISKQGLYLHFSNKEKIFQAALQKYLDDGLASVREELTAPHLRLIYRLVAALDAWFGRHLVTFSPEAFDLIETGDRLSGRQLVEYQNALQSQLEKALADSAEFKRTANICSPNEVSQVLLMCGLSWKDGYASRAHFAQKMGLCVRACCQVGVGVNQRGKTR